VPRVAGVVMLRSSVAGLQQVQRLSLWLHVRSEIERSCLRQCLGCIVVDRLAAGLLLCRLAGEGNQFNVEILTRRSARSRHS
jgi:hypothetical protein